MRVCGQCYYFSNKFQVFDKEFSCAELFQKEDSVVCGDFKINKDDVKVSPITQVEQDLELEKQHFTYQADYFDIIKQDFVQSQDLHIVINKIRDELDIQGINVPFNDSTIKRYQQKLSDLALLQRLILVNGMGPYIDDIMKLEIEKKFKKELSH